MEQPREADWSSIGAHMEEYQGVIVRGLVKFRQSLRSILDLSLWEAANFSIQQPFTPGVYGTLSTEALETPTSPKTKHTYDLHSPLCLVAASSCSRQGSEPGAAAAPRVL
ncbi:hypothetical protein QYF61_004575 [Mycteria americana]|uniref:Uncharacterized protein n=1 Tax=Mycteria americana TaxID=33587 RepID=A0AAN7NVY8_MYCAM|nr:hypothetical protein QYF61_004575 [Mycteria americana]